MTSGKIGYLVIVQWELSTFDPGILYGKMAAHFLPAKRQEFNRANKFILAFIKWKIQLEFNLQQ